MTRHPVSAALPVALAFALLAPAALARDDHRGLYFSVGGGIGLQSTGGDGVLGYLGEARLGFSVNRRLQVFLGGDTGGGTHQGTFVLDTNILAGLRYFLFTDEGFGVYARGGFGVGIVSGSGSSSAGFSEAYGLGLEFRLDNRWSLSPEVFYRRSNESSDARVDFVGIGISLGFN